ncbi:hypothetical protein P9B03_14910 [Metasolibacillus meyeri]|uniref:DUF1310 family protein n=1 Tax=Metasolibacillus meyeri TaxID=1071052 RepID=A0AAW9NTU8_9BACL|nr:hypothetical protein [Metasolibacillus meyeri]MEC1179787.1 hypothetical protein [Metasolibacillus meyeri]
MKRKIVAVCILIVCIITIITGVSYIPQKLIKTDIKEIVKIEMTNGHTGQHVEIMDSKEISQLLANLANITIQKEQSAKEIKGYHYLLKLYTDKGEVQQFTISEPDTIGYKKALYKTKGSLIDTTYIEHLF